MAEEQNRSLSAQVITLLEQAVEMNLRSQAEIIASIWRLPALLASARGPPHCFDKLGLKWSRG
ncbi:MAG: hypothetical protein ACUVV0_13450, partial [Anaerolineae bacterium]